MTWIEKLAGFWHYFVAALTLLISVVASGHALLYKRDTRAAALWVGFTWLAPLVGAVIYFIFGVNRIKRKAVLLRGGRERCDVPVSAAPLVPKDLARRLPPEARHLAAIAEVVERMSPPRPLLEGNRLDPLLNGDAAFPAMLEAIAAARHSITLSTYIFDRDETGIEFAAALGQAARRGVQVRALIDAAGTRYSFPSILPTLRREGVTYARFLPSFPLWRMLSMNLRNHRKMMVVDGQLAFTGGMNIRAGNRLARQPRHPVQDLHFRVEGPVVAQIQEVFADDWLFTTGESLCGEDWFPRLEPAGTVTARGISDGPDEDYEKLRWTILGALATARRSVRILTPYFLPDAAIISALNLAAMRGIAVEIILPARGNLPFVQWASIAHWWQVLEKGCRIWVSPPPFDHSKLFLVDDDWAMIGSANWDPRSLRLNFEFNLECYCPELVRSLNAIFQEKLAQSREVTLTEVDARNIAVRLRDGIARLFTPFL